MHFIAGAFGKKNSPSPSKQHWYKLRGKGQSSVVSTNMPSTTEALKVLAVSLLENIDVVPGSKIVKDYVKRSYQNDPFRVALEALLFFFAVKYMTTKKYQPNDNDVKLTDKVHT